MASALDEPKDPYLSTDATPPTASIPSCLSTFSDDVDFSLETILRVFQHKWVWDFFFAPQSDLHEQLKFAIKQTVPKSVEYSMKLAHQFPVNSDTTIFNGFGNLFFLSSFCAGGITVGFAVDELIQSAQLILQSPLTFFHVVRDDANTCYLAISENPDSGLVQFHCIRLISPARRQRYIINFHQKRFRFAIERLRDGHFDENLFRRAMMIVLYLPESRTCPNCRTPPSHPPCSCQLTVCKMRHPLDITSDNYNLVTYLGAYSGFCQVLEYRSPLTPPLSSHFACKTTTSLALDPDVSRRLSNWALRNCASLTHLSIRPLQMTNIYQHAHVDIDVDHINNFTPITFLQNMENNALKKFNNRNFDSIGLPLIAKKDIITEQRVQHNFLDSFSTEQTRLIKTNNNSTESQFENYVKDQSVDKTNTFLPTLSPDEREHVMLSDPTHESQSLQPQTNSSTITYCMRSASPVSRFDLMKNPTVGFTNSVVPTLTTQSLQIHPVKSANSGTELQIRRELVAIAPAPLPLSEQYNMAFTQHTVRDEQSLKKEIRKRKNRVAAHRSNERRKKKIAQQKNEINK